MRFKCVVVNADIFVVVAENKWRFVVVVAVSVATNGDPVFLEKALIELNNVKPK